MNVEQIIELSYIKFLNKIVYLQEKLFLKKESPRIEVK